MIDEARPTREALLDAAYDAVVGPGWADTRMADVARAAGLSRQTLYNEFGSKDALLQAVALREAERFIAATEACLNDADPREPVAAVAAATAYAVRAAAGNLLIKATFTDDGGGLLPFLTTRGQPVFVAARSAVRSYLVEHWPHLPTDEVDAAAEAVVRLTLSYILLPSEDPDSSAEAVAGRVAHLVERLLEPYSRRS